MSKFWHTFFHVVAITIQVATLATNLVPAPYQALVAGVISALQAAVALYNHTQPTK